MGQVTHSPYSQNLLFGLTPTGTGALGPDMLTGVRLIRLLKRDLAKEIATWVDRELISVDQAQAICRLYGVDYTAILARSTAYSLLVVLGCGFIGLALITVIGANWDTIPRGLRMAGLLALTVGTHGLALRLYLSGSASQAAGLFILGSLFYGASIILIAQIYHLGEHMPDGVFWWALGSLPFGVVLCHAWLTLLSAWLALVWFFMEYALGFFGASFPLFVAAQLYVLVRGRPSISLFLTAVVSLFFWIEAALSVLWADSSGRLEPAAEHVFVGVALFILARAASHYLQARDESRAKDYGAVLSVWTLRLGLLGLLVLSFEAPWADLIEADWNNLGSMWVVVGASMAGAVWLGTRTARLPSLLTLSLLSLLSAAAMLAVMLIEDADGAVYLQILGNISLVGAGTWLIVQGTLRGISHYFSLGVGTILLTAFLRYVDLIGDYIGAALLFLVLALVLLGAARYWKVRQTQEGQA